MKLDIDIKDFRVNGGGKFKISKAPTKLKKRLYSSEADLKAKLSQFHEEIDRLQQKMFAHDRHAMLLIFQAMDAAGKDGTLRHVMSGINPAGVEVHYFKRPSEEELDHDFLWRCQKVAPQRGRIGIFNRSYYEEVLICRVHSDIVTKVQRLPEVLTEKLPRLFERRLRDIRNYEDYLGANGITVVKFFLNVSKAEQCRRFLARIDDPSKNWKFNAGDLKERAFWNDYMDAYEEAINGTAGAEAPWYVVPADDKGDMRLIVSRIILKHLERLSLNWPTLPKYQQAMLAECRKQLMAECGGKMPKEKGEKDKKGKKKKRGKKEDAPAAAESPEN